MKGKIIVGLIAVVALVAVVMFVGCIEEEVPTSSAVYKVGDRIVLGEKRYERAFTIEDVKVVTFTKGITDECDVFERHYTVKWKGKGTDEFTVLFIKVHFEDIGYATEAEWYGDRIQFIMEDIYGDSIKGRGPSSWADLATGYFEESRPMNYSLIYVYDDYRNWIGMQPYAVLFTDYDSDIYKKLILEYMPAGEYRTISIKLIG